MKKNIYLNKCKMNGVNIDKFDFSLLTDDINTKMPIYVICEYHGKFKCNPYHFSVGNSECVECRKNEKYLNRIKNIHSDRFDYSKFKFNGVNNKVIIIENNIEYLITYNSLLNPDIKLHSLENECNNFILESIKKHHNKFNYDQVINTFNGLYGKKVKIKCNKHNIYFDQVPYLHLSSDFCCPDCVNDYKSNKTSKTKKEFIKNAIKIHGTKYDYSKVNYINNKTPVEIIYNDISYFQRPDSHLSGRCPEIDKWGIKTTEEFINDAIKIHGNRYDYSKVNYKTAKDKVIIICREHGEFEQIPNSHLNGNNCSRCSQSFGENKIEQYLIFNKINYETQKTFEGCININKLRFDFYLTDYNICVEYDGIQHFESIDFFGGDERFKQTQINDNIKNEFCEKNNIKLIRISYKENIEEKLDELIMYKKMNQEEKNLKFIEKARKVWGLKYNYIKTKYVDYRTPVIIMYEGIEYKQTPSKHLAGKKCELSNNKLSKDEFVRRCNIQWDNRFDYSNTNYINSYSDIEFYDKKLDIVINQKAYSHMSGNKYSINKDNFIILSNRIYDYKYDYSRVEYDKLTDDIIIRCPDHGLFKVNGYNHLNNTFGSCKECDEYNIIKFIDKYLDENLINYHKEHYFDNLALPFSYYFPKNRKVIDIFIEKNDKSLKNNKIKNEYCEDNFIDLIEIREYDIFRIENILNNIFH